MLERKVLNIFNLRYVLLLSLVFLLNACDSGDFGDFGDSVVIDSIEDKAITRNASLQLQVRVSGISSDSFIKYAVSNASFVLGTVEIDGNGKLKYKAKNKFGIDKITVTVTDIKYGNSAKKEFFIHVINSRVSAVDFHSSGQKIRGKAVSPHHNNNKDTCNYVISASHQIPQSFSNQNDYELKLASDGKFTFVSNVRYLGLTKVPVDVKCSKRGVHNIELSFKTEITGTDYNDPYIRNQWHQHNTGQNNSASNGGTPDHDINIGLLHLQGVTGEQIGVAVMDDGLEIGHEDLSDNIAQDLSYDYKNDDHDPTSATTHHGTMVAGIISAVANNGLGGHGIAPNALLRGFNLSLHYNTLWLLDCYRNRLHGALILNKSFAKDQLNSRSKKNDIEKAIIEIGNYLNGGRGIFTAKAAGNEFKREQYLLNNKLYTLSRDDSHNPITKKLPNLNAGAGYDKTLFENTVVAALSADARNPHSSYSSSGANVFISAPGGEDGNRYPAIFTTSGSSKDKLGNDATINYTHHMNGTSSATPVVSGVAALIYQVNEQLTWRDVRHIMAKTAKKIDNTNSSEVVLTRGNERFVAQDAWVTNAAGNSFHNWYGFGMVDATKAVQMAANGYKNLPPLRRTDWEVPVRNTNLTIPESFTGASKQVHIPNSLTVEAIQIKISITHSRPSDLAIVVTSPSGTRSVIFTPLSMIGYIPYVDEKFDETVLLSNAFYGESAYGDWTIQVVDTDNDYFDYYFNGTPKSKANNSTLGIFNDVGLKVYGHEYKR